MTNHGGEILGSARRLLLNCTFKLAAERIRNALTEKGLKLTLPRSPMGETEITLTVGDCLTEMRHLNDQSVDVVVTSPPYNLGVQYSKYQDDRKRSDYLAWSVQWAGEVKRVLKDSGSFFLNLGACPSNPLLPHQLILKLSASFVLQNTFHWIKSITVETRAGEQVSAGHFKPIRSQRFVNDCHEYVFHLTKAGETNLDRLGVGVAYTDKSNIARWGHTKGKDLRCRGNTWFVPYKTILSRSKDRPHPATFPVALAENCLRIHGNCTTLTVLDPFVGIGHSALAARNCGVLKFIGIDIDPEYVAVARMVTQSDAAPPKQPVPGRAKRKDRTANPTFFDNGLMS